MSQSDCENVEEAGETTGGIIPYKNPSALIAYYCGVFSLVPCVGLLPGLAGLVFGIKGLRYAKAYPAARGHRHAVIGIIVGGLFMLIWGGVAVSFALTIFRR